MEVQRITVHELNAIIEKGEPVTIIDVRDRSAYATSRKKIKGALYLDPDDEAGITALAGTTDKNRPVVTY